jgi:hypothetical protein
MPHPPIRMVVLAVHLLMFRPTLIRIPRHRIRIIPIRPFPIRIRSTQICSLASLTRIPEPRDVYPLCAFVGRRLRGGRVVCIESKSLLLCRSSLTFGVDRSLESFDEGKISRARDMAIPKKSPYMAKYHTRPSGTKASSAIMANTN